MATLEEERRRLRERLVAPSGPAPLFRDVSQAARQAGGGARGVGAGTRTALNQLFVQPQRQAVDAAIRPAGAFLSGFLDLPSPDAAAPRRPGAPGPDFPTIATAQPARAPAQPPAQPPLLPGQTARAQTPQTGQPRGTDPTFGIDNVPQGGGFIAFDEPLRGSTRSRVAPSLLDQLDRTGAIRITPDQAQSMAGGVNTVPSSFFSGGEASRPAQRAGDQGGPRRSTFLSDRSQDFDGLLKDLVGQATRTPGSYDELFRRRGVLDALGQVAGVSQGAATNLTRDITNLRDVLEQRRNNDLDAESQAAERSVTTRGQDLLFDRGVLQNLVSARNTDVQAGANLAATEAQIASNERLSDPARELQTMPKAQFELQLLKRQNANGTPMTQQQYEENLAAYREIYGQQDLFSLLAQQQR